MTNTQLTQEWVDKVTRRADDEGLCSAGGPPPPAIPSKEEWQRRFAARIMTCASWDEIPAMQCAAAGFELMVSEAPEFVLDPEGAADEEMSCWTDDGDE
jgi:hypothetical protein